MMARSLYHRDVGLEAFLEEAGARSLASQQAGGRSKGLRLNGCEVERFVVGFDVAELEAVRVK